MPKEKPGYYGILPAKVRYDKRLKANEKIMFTEITALSNKYGYCSANNHYFSDLYEVTKRNVSTWINDLKNYGYVLIQYERKDNQITKRKIYPITNPSAMGIEKNFNTPGKKSSGGYGNKFQHPREKNFQDNTTRDNTTRDNTTRENKGNETAINPSSDNESNVTNDTNNRSFDSEDIHKALSFYQKNVGTISPFQAEQLQAYSNDFSSDMIIEAIKVALNKNIRSIKFIKGVLNTWHKKNVHTLEEKKADDLEHKKQYSNNINDSKDTTNGGIIEHENGDIEF